MAVINKLSIVDINNGYPITTSLAIANGVGNPHKSVLQLIRQNVSDLEYFGGVAFEMRPFDTAGGMQNREIAQLNEQQATLLLTYMRNNDTVRVFKRQLVKAFFDMKDMLNQKRYYFPVETADPHDRDLANALITAKTILDERNNAPELDLLNRLEQDGYDVSGAKIRIYAMYRVAKQLIDMQAELSNVHRQLQLVDNSIAELTVQRGENVVFQGRDAGTVIGRCVTRSLPRK